MAVKTVQKSSMFRSSSCCKKNFIQKITVIPKGQSPRVKCNICNIPISIIDSNFKSLPRPAFSNNYCKILKKKAVYRACPFWTSQTKYNRKFMKTKLLLKANNQLC